MEFDIVERRHHDDGNTTCRWSSTLLTGSTIVTSMEFDIADGSSYSWSMELDIVELWKTVA